MTAVLRTSQNRSSASGSVCFVRAFQSATSFSAALETGICRTPASVLGVSKQPSYTASPTLSILHACRDLASAAQTAHHAGDPKASRGQPSSGQAAVAHPAVGRLLRRQHPLRADGLERRQVDVTRRIRCQMAPLDCRAQHRAQHIVDMVDGPSGSSGCTCCSSSKSPVVACTWPAARPIPTANG